MRLADIMSTDVEEIPPSESAAMAWDRMGSHRIRHLVVVDGARVVGILSERELHALDPRVRLAKTVGELMAPNPVTATPETTLQDAANLLRGNGIGCLPILDGARLAGIVTITDLLEELGRGFAEHGRGAQSREGRGAKKRPGGGRAPRS